MGTVVALPQVGGLHHRYERRSAPKSIMLRVAAWALAICTHTVSLAGPYINSETQAGPHAA